MPIQNPYANVNWSTVLSIPSVNHAHLNSTAELQNAYNNGIRHFAITEYHPSKTRYPLEDFYFTGDGESLPVDVIGCPNTEISNANGIVSSFHYTHPGSVWDSSLYNEGETFPWRESIDNSLDNLYYPNGGGVIVAHPVWSNLKLNDMTKILDYSEQVLGLEAISHISGISNYADMIKYIDKTLAFWDSVIATGRRCFGYFVPDHSAKIGTWWGRNILLVDQATEQACINAYTNGELYGSLEGQLSYLKFTGITATDTTITVNTDGGTRIWFYTQKGLAQETKANTATYTLKGDETFVRVVALRGTERIYSQPIMYKDVKTVKKERMIKTFIAVL